MGQLPWFGWRNALLSVLQLDQVGHKQQTNVGVGVGARGRGVFSWILKKISSYAVFTQKPKIFDLASRKMVDVEISAGAHGHTSVGLFTDVTATNRQKTGAKWR